MAAVPATQFTRINLKDNPQIVNEYKATEKYSEEEFTAIKHMLMQKITKFRKFYMVKLFYGDDAFKKCQDEKDSITNIFSNFDPKLHSYLTTLFGLEESPYINAVLKLNEHFPAAPALIIKSSDDPIQHSSQYFTTRHFYYFFQTLKFLNYFAIHNNLNGNSLYFNIKKNMITITDCGLSYNPKYVFTSDRIDPTYSIETFIHLENEDQICDLVQGSMKASVASGFRRDVANQWKDRMFPWEIQIEHWNKQIKEMVHELRHFQTKQPDMFTRYLNMKRDLYSSAVALHDSISFLSYRQPLLQLFCILMRHPNPILRPSSATFIKLLSKIISCERYETHFVYTTPSGELEELCKIPSYLDESLTISLNTKHLITDQIHFTLDPNLKKLEYASYFITMHLLYVFVNNETLNYKWIDWVNKLRANPDWINLLSRYSVSAIFKNPFLSKSNKEWIHVQQFVFTKLRDMIVATEQAQYSLRSGIPIDGHIPFESIEEPFDSDAIGFVTEMLSP